MSKYGHRPQNWFEAIVNKLGGEDAADRFLRGELSVSQPTCSWREENDIIYFSVTSDGATGEDWIRRLEEKGLRVGDNAKELLRSSDFQPTSGVTTEVAVFKGTLFHDNIRSTNRILAEADKRKLLKPSTELACLIREMFKDKELRLMGLSNIFTMHEPIIDSDNDSILLVVSRQGFGSWIFTRVFSSTDDFKQDDGFAFVVANAST